MKIQQKNGKILISTNGCKIQVSDIVEINDKDGDATQISSPGEYEYSGVMVQAVSKLESKDVLLYSLDIEGVNLVYIDAESSMPTKKQIEQIGLNNILIVKIVDGVEKVRDLIDLFEPEFVIPLTENQAELDSLAKKLGTLLPEKQPVFNASAELFENNEEELALQMFILE